VIVHQILSGAGPVDAVTSQARAFRKLFTAWGWGGQDVAAEIDPAVGRAVRPLTTLRPDASDVLLLHYSAYAPKLERLLNLPNPKLLLSHNVTPARWFWQHDPYTAMQCSLGRRHLPLFVRAAEVAAGVSHYNVSELRAAGARHTDVIPILFDPAVLGPPGPEPGGSPKVLFVGRLAPHKRQDEILRAFALYRRYRAPDARLVLVGWPITPAYREGLAELAETLAPGAVTIESALAPEALADHYRSAHVFLCLSEHEGFCVPLLEAFHFGVPVVARPVGGIPEVAGDAALLLEDRDPAVVAELLHLVVNDASLRAELRRRGRERLAEFDPRRTAEKLRSVLEGIGANGARPAATVNASQAR
jgi:glycosyltransferase involved in cell wall biosynthesis